MPRVYGQRNYGSREFVLTFDDGPLPATTGLLLDTLAKYEIKAVFFTVGKLLATSQGAAIARRAQAEGHILGNHSFSHLNLRGLTKGKVREELRRTHDLICECAGGCKYFRPPYGASSAVVTEVLQDLGYVMFLWNVDALDWKLKNGGQWVDHAMDQIEGREDCILLMHDIHRSTVDHMERLIQSIKRVSGHRFTLY